MYTTSKNYDIEKPTSQFFASQLINTEWVKPGNGSHKVFAATGDLLDAVGHSLITAYALQRPDGQWSVMLVNRDQENSHTVRIEFDERDNSSTFSGQVNVASFGSTQYQWHPDAAGGFPEPDGPVAKSTITAAADTSFELPKASIITIRGSISNPATKSRTH
jgi:hypothetical protein